MKALLCIALLLQGCLFSSGDEPKQVPDSADGGSSTQDANLPTADGSTPPPDMSAPGPDVSTPPDLGPPPDIDAPCVDGTFDCSNDGGFECKNGVWQPMTCPDDQTCDEAMGCRCRETCVPGNGDVCDPRPNMRGAVINRCEISPSGCPTHVAEPCDGVCSQANGPELECIGHECDPSDNRCVDKDVFELCDRSSQAEPFAITTMTCVMGTVCHPDELAAGRQPCVPCAQNCDQVGELSCAGSNSWVECRQTSPNCRENVPVAAPCTPPPLNSNDTWQFVACGPQSDDIQRCYRDNSGCADLRVEKCGAGKLCVQSSFNCQ